MSDWEDPVQRAAVWYVAAFGAVGSVLLAGMQLTGFNWTRASHPLGAVVVISIAVTTAAGVVVLATLVLTPRYTLDKLADRQRKAEARAHRKTRARRPYHTKGKGTKLPWKEVANEDALLRSLFIQDFFRDEDDSPLSLGARQQPVKPGDGRPDTDPATAQERESAMLQAANHRTARSAFDFLRWTAPVAVLVILACTLAWPQLSRPMERVASASAPVPVEVTLVKGQDPGMVVGPGCTRRSLAGVAISGDLQSAPLVAVPDQDDCPAALIRVTGGIGSVHRKSQETQTPR